MLLISKIITWPILGSKDTTDSLFYGAGSDGPSEKPKILSDEWGIPHIFAADLEGMRRKARVEEESTAKGDLGGSQGVDSGTCM